MLIDLKKLVDRVEDSGITQAEIENTASMLRLHQFIWRDKRNHARHYDLLVKFQDYYRNLFDAFGDTYVVDHHFGYCGIVPRTSYPRLKMLETVYLLILAKLHDNESRRACTENGRSMPGEAILIDEYRELTGKPAPKKTETREALVRLSRCGVIELGELNPETELNRITVLPSITRIVSKSFLDELDTFAKGKSEGLDKDEVLDELDGIAALSIEESLRGE